MKIIAYNFEKDCHCIPCAVKRFAGLGSAINGFKDANGIHYYQEDSGGNLVDPIYSTDELPSSHCGTCGKEISK